MLTRLIGTIIGSVGLPWPEERRSMPDYETILHKEDQEYARFEQMLADGERRVSEQILRIERLRADGHDTTRAERFLAELEKSLEEWRQTRDDISAIEQTYHILNDVARPASQPA